MHTLIEDTLTYLKEHTHPISFFATQEESLFFESQEKQPPHPIELQPVKVAALPIPTNPPSSIAATLRKIAPQVVLHDAPLPASPAVWILLADNSEETLHFIKNLARAIDERLSPVKIVSACKIEAENRWEAWLSSLFCSLLITTDQIHQLERGSHALTHWKGAPILHLSATSTYSQQAAKQALWQKLCQILKA